MNGNCPPSRTTSDQMLDAPEGAIYVWPRMDLYYPKKLAEHLGRADLRIIGPRQESLHLVSRFIRNTVVFDHACAQGGQHHDALGMMQIIAWSMSPNNHHLADDRPIVDKAGPRNFSHY